MGVLRVQVRVVVGLQLKLLILKQPFTYFFNFGKTLFINLAYKEAGSDFVIPAIISPIINNICEPPNLIRLAFSFV